VSERKPEFDERSVKWVEDQFTNYKKSRFISDRAFFEECNDFPAYFDILFFICRIFTILVHW